MVNIYFFLKNVLRFWLDKGIDGFRADAVHFLCEDDTFADEPQINDKKINGVAAYASLEHIHTRHLPKTLDILAQFREVLDSYKNRDGHTR